jgi:hypothetical protein
MPPDTDDTRHDPVVDLAALARAGAASGALWAYGGGDLNANLVLLTGLRQNWEHKSLERRVQHASTSTWSAVTRP